MDEKELMKIIESFGKKLPKFPDGRIDYHNSDKAPVITVFIRMGDKVLLLKRSDKVLKYRGKWNSVAGYLDEVVPVRKKVLEELREEAGIEEEDILSIKTGELYEFRDGGYTWMVTPVMAEIKEGTRIKTDWEHVEYRWITPGEISGFDTVPNLERGLEIVMGKKSL